MDPRTGGRYMYHEAMNNVTRLLDLCQNYCFQPAHKRFPHRTGRLWTRQHSSGSPAQLDHILLRSKWINSLINVRSYKTVSVDSDHRIVTTNIKVSLRLRKSTKNPQTKYNWEVLRNMKNRETFVSELKNRYYALIDKVADRENEDPSTQKSYGTFVKAVKETSEKALGKRCKQSGPSWIYTQTLDVEQQRQSKAKVPSAQNSGHMKTMERPQNQTHRILQ